MMHLDFGFPLLLLFPSVHAVVVPAIGPELVGDIITERQSNGTRGDGSDLPMCSKDTHGTCLYDKKGNTVVGFSDNSMNFGTVAPADMIKAAHDQCSKLTGSCAGTFQKETNTIHKPYGMVHDGKVTCSYSGNYKSKLKANIIDALVESTHKTTKLKHIPSGIDGYTQHRHCTTFAVKIPGDNPGATNDASSLLVKCEIDIERPQDDNFCSTFFSIAGTVAGAVDGVAGGVLSLFGLLCNPQ